MDSLWISKLSSFAQVGIYLPFYDMFRNRLEELSREKAPAMTFCVPTVAGSLARSLACTVCYPIDLARTRMQVLACTSSVCVFL